MKQHLNEGNKKLPIIINEVIYAGKESPYPYTVDILNMFENPALAKELMFKPPKMTDLTVKTEEELVKEGVVGLMEVMIKQGICRDHLNWIKNRPHLVYEIVNSPFGYASILYILATDAVNSPEKLKKAIMEAAPNQEKLVMTAAQQLIQEGREVGIELGMEKRSLETAQNMLAKHLAIELISDITGLSVEKIKSLS